MSDNVIKFPVTDRDDDERIFVEYSATPDQLLQFCVLRLLRIEASVHALAICLGNEPIESEDFVQSYREVRRGAVKDLIREFEQQFPIKNN